MDRIGRNVEYLIRLIIIAAAVLGALLAPERFKAGSFVLLLLTFTLNAQIRLVFLKNKGFLISVFVDIILACYIYSSSGGITNLLLLIPMLDGLILLEEEGYAVLAIVLGVLVYLLRHKSMEFLILNMAIFLILFVFSQQIKKLRNKIHEVEYLYDENRKYSYQLEDAKKMLEDYSKKVEQLSQLEERNRISREIHDTVGHRLTGVLMQLDASIRVNGLDREKGRDMLTSVRDNLSSCIDILRQTVRSMQPGGGNRASSIRQMLEDFSRDTGVKIQFEVRGNQVKLYPSAEITLYRNAQEAVTNAVRHGRAKNIAVRLDYEPNQVIMTVSDDGIGCTDMVKGMGIGGMEERAGLLGGRIEITSGRSFGIRTFLPLK